MNLFEQYEQQPKALRAITDKWSEVECIDGLDYKDCEAFLKEVQAIGYTFEYGLDAEPYDLQPMEDRLDSGDIALLMFYFVYAALLAVLFIFTN